MTTEAVTTPTDLITMAGPVAYAKAVQHAQSAAESAELGDHESARTNAAVATAFAAIAGAEANARCSALVGRYPEGGWKQHTHPEDKPWWAR